LPQPCRLLPAALTVVNEGGEIWMLDSANFNVSTVTVFKSVTILAVPGALGSVVANGADAIQVNLGPTTEVTLRNLVILNLSGVGNTGVKFLQGSQLTVEGCEIYGMGTGIRADATGGLATVKDTTIRDSDTGVLVQGSVLAALERVNLLNNGSAGITVGSGAQASVSESTLSGSATGASVQATGSTTSRLALTSTELSGNATAVSVSAAAGADTAQVVLEDTTITHNGTGVALSGAGTRAAYSRQNNALKFNGSDVTGGALTPQGAL
jgi:nitrous oxidase accessory protein NosD